MELVLEKLELIARYTGYIMSVIVFLGFIIKPVRKWAINKITKITHKNEVEELTKGFLEFKDWVQSNITEIKEMVFENEKDRLKGELFSYGNKCRRGVPITLEEFRYIQEVYQKYNVTLHCNHNGTEEYEFIRDYFNSPQNQERIKK